jgi:hypothetical protein
VIATGSYLVYVIQRSLEGCRQDKKLIWLPINSLCSNKTWKIFTSHSLFCPFLKLDIGSGALNEGACSSWIDLTFTQYMICNRACFFFKVEHRHLTIIENLHLIAHLWTVSIYVDSYRKGNPKMWPTSLPIKLENRVRRRNAHIWTVHSEQNKVERYSLILWSTKITGCYYESIALF